MPNYQVVEFLQTTEEGSRWASRHILEAYGLLEQYDLDFSRSEKTLALATRKQLTPIVYHAGLALNGPLLKSIIKRQERQAVESCIGRDSYNYALKKGPFLAGHLPQSFDAGFVIDWNNPEELKKHIFRTGVRLLGAVYGEECGRFSKAAIVQVSHAEQRLFLCRTSGRIFR